MKKTKILSLGALMSMAMFLGACTQSTNEIKGQADGSPADTQTVMINEIELTVNAKYIFYTWDQLPSDLTIERKPIVEFTNTNGETHYYELVYMPNGTLNWYQAAYLADDAGGYLASITTPEENAFLFSLVNDEKYFWKFPKYVEGKSKANHYEIMIGPMLGGFKHDASVEPIDGWQWLSGEKWEYTNWAQNLDDGIIDKDPRNNTQPNNSGEQHSQRTIGFGELNQPVPTWGDFSDDAGTFGMERTGGKRYAFIIEYNKKPNN